MDILTVNNVSLGLLWIAQDGLNLRINLVQESLLLVYLDTS